jgi:hypothetical protein
VPFQVDPMLIPMFGRGNLSQKFATGGKAKALSSIKKGVETAKKAVKDAKKDGPLYSPKVLESTASRIADQLRKQNPKLTDEAIKQRSERLAAQKLQWERGQKPALEKEFGELVKAPSSASKMQKDAKRS